MKNKQIAETELIINTDGSVYHLHLRPENISENIILVGDQGRVAEVSKYFENIEFRAQNREFVTHTGLYKGKRITALSTGIGTDNIDIVVNELDALANIDLETRTVKRKKTSLSLVRIGTSGALQGDVDVDSFVVSEYGLGFDGLLNYYDGMKKINEPSISSAFMRQAKWKKALPYPYTVKGSAALIKRIGAGMHSGITATAPGFYGPQGRVLRLKPALKDLNEKLTAFRHKHLRIANFEMETSALYGLSKLLGHRACTVCAIIANRVRKEYSGDYKTAVDRLIRTVLDRI